MNRILICRRTSGICAALMAMTMICAVSMGYPEPNIVPTSWQLDFKHEKPQLLAVRLPGEERTRLYYYFTYTVTNRTGSEQLWVPEVWINTDAGDLIRANSGVSPTIFNAIKARERNPLLESPVQVVGTILQGADNARDGMVVWEVPGKDVNNIRMFITGLSGETHVVQDPVTSEDRLLRKTLMLEYNTPGDLAHIQSKPFIFVGEQWIVR